MVDAGSEVLADATDAEIDGFLAAVRDDQGMYVVYDGTFFLTGDTRFGEVPSEPPSVFSDEQSAVSAAEYQNGQFSGFLVRDGELARARPWKVYRLVEV